MKRKGSFKCGQFFLALVVLYALQPHLSAFEKAGIPFLGRIGSELFGEILYSLTLLSAIYATSRNRKRVLIGLSLIIPALILSWMSVLIPGSPVLVTLRVLALLAALIYTGATLFQYVLEGKGISLDQVFAGISIYFLLGHAWALVYGLLEYHSPGSFQGLSTAEKGSELVYYSFVTLTTLGYGEITPVSAQARSLAALESVAGVLYIAVLVSRLVSSYRAPGDRI